MIQKPGDAPAWWATIGSYADLTFLLIQTPSRSRFPMFKLYDLLISLRSQVMKSACSSYGNCRCWFTKLMSYFFQREPLPFDTDGELRRIANHAATSSKDGRWCSGYLWKQFSQWPGIHSGKLYNSRTLREHQMTILVSLVSYWIFKNNVRSEYSVFKFLTYL